MLYLQAQAYNPLDVNQLKNVMLLYSAVLIEKAYSTNETLCYTLH